MGQSPLENVDLFDNAVTLVRANPQAALFTVDRDGMPYSRWMTTALENPSTGVYSL